MKKYIPFLAFFLLGSLLGAITINMLNLNKINNLYIENQNQLLQIEEQNNRLSKLEESLLQEKQRVINNILILPNIDNELKKIKIKEICNNLLKDVVGKEVEIIDPMLIYNMLNERKITVNGEELIILVKILVIDIELEVFIDIQSIDTKSYN